jgi:2-alkyl-3-oxoalkanoate reductase
LPFGLSNRSIAVTGATGLIGSAVVRALLKSGARVRALVRNPAKAAILAQQGADVHGFDLTIPGSFFAAFADCEVVFHFAAVLNDFKSHEHYWRSNVEGTKAVAEAAMEAGVERFVYASTAWVHGMDSGFNTTEESPFRKSASFYADTKREAEQLIRTLHTERGLPAIIVRPTQVYGPGDETWTRRPLQLIRQGKMVLIDGGRGLIQPIFIDDVVEGILRAAERGRTGEAYILCGDRSITMAEYFGYFARMLHKTTPRSIPRWLAFAVATLAESIAHISGRPPLFTRQEVRATLTERTYDGSKARRELGSVPRTDLERGMLAVEQWIKETKIQ